MPRIRNPIPHHGYADEDQHLFITPFPLVMHGKAQGTHKRCVERILSENTSATPMMRFVQHHKVKLNNRVKTLPISKIMELDMKKGKSGSCTKEYTHMLNILHGQYMQWRFVNAVPEAFVEPHTFVERSLFEVLKKLKKLRDLITHKRMELDKILRLRRLFDIFNLEMSYLEEWASVDGEYSDSLSGIINALKDASIRLQLIGDVRVDVRELKEFIHSIISMLESFPPSIERLSPNANGVAKEISELAKGATREKALIEECGGLLFEAHRLQVKVCSL